MAFTRGLVPSAYLLQNVFIITTITVTVIVDAKFNIHGNKDGSYVISVNDKDWLKSGPIAVQADGRHHSTADHTLTQTDPPRPASGTDTFGAWDGQQCGYAIAGKHIADMGFRRYVDVSAVVFSQTFLVTLDNTTVGSKDGVISGFPSVHIGGGGVDLGFLLYSGLFIGWTKMKINKWKSGLPKLVDGMEGGPLLLFDKSDNVLIISPFNHFMAASIWHDQGNDVITWGIMGDVNQIPAGFNYETIVYYGDKGINQAMADWGRLMRTWYRKSVASRESDVSLNYIGYYTDNGAYYYNVTEPGINYEATMLTALKYSQKENIPYRYLQYDDWFYPIEGPGYGATVTWDAKPSVFPHGLRYLYNKTELPVVAHNRYWSHKTTYAKKNGGRFNFLIDGGMSLPDDQSFWDYLFATAKQWGLVVYEQDWLDHQTEYIRPLFSDLTLGSRWLKQMGEAATRHGIQIQYCMALPRHLLASLEIPSVSHIRASIDYHLNDSQWTIGITSMFADALGLAPFKDNFWSKEIQPGNKYNKTEPSPLLQATVSLLSTGPVGVGDRIGYSDAKLLRRLTTQSGRLLHPSKPATAINAQLLQRAYGDSSNLGPSGEVWTAYSQISGLQFGIVLSAELRGSFSLGPREAGFSQQSSSVVYKWNISDPTTVVLRQFDTPHPVRLTGCTYTDFCLFHTSPVFKWRGKTAAILGELDKVLPMSPHRVDDVSIGQNDVTVVISGTPGEVVDFYVFTDKTGIRPIRCIISGDFTAKLSFATASCR